MFNKGFLGKLDPGRKGNKILLKASFSGHLIMGTLNTDLTVNICYFRHAWFFLILRPPVQWCLIRPLQQAAGSVLCPELQCFISDYQLTRDAALHHGPEVWTWGMDLRYPWTWCIHGPGVWTWDIHGPGEWTWGMDLRYLWICFAANWPHVWCEQSCFSNQPYLLITSSFGIRFKK